MTLAAFIVAFGVSRVLSGWVQQFVRRRETPVYPLQLAVSGLMLLALLQNSWAMFMAQGADWTFFTFLVMILLQISIVGALALINPPPDYASSIRHYYFDVRKAVFGLLIAWIVIGGFFDMLGPLSSDQPLDPNIPYALMYSIRAVAVAVFGLMAWSGRESHHWAGFIVASVIQALWIVGFSYNPASA